MMSIKNSIALSPRVILVYSCKYRLRKIVKLELVNVSWDSGIDGSFHGIVVMLLLIRSSLFNINLTTIARNAHGCHYSKKHYPVR